MKNMKSTMRGYLILGIFAVIMTVVMGLGHTSIKKINDAPIDQQGVSTVQSLDEVEILEMVEIERIPERRLMITL